MVTYSIIQKSQLEGAHRLDAEYYQQEYLSLISKLKSKKSKIFLGEVVKKIIHPKEIKRDYSESGYLFLLAQNVKPGFLDFSEKRYFSEEVAKTMPQNLLKKGDILFVRTGAVGDVAIYLGKPEKVLASAHVLIARPNFKISPYYLMVFFNTHAGRNLIIRGTYGALQPEVAPDYLKTILVPVVNKDFENEVEQLVFKSNELLGQSESLYSQAENLLLEELGLKNFEVEDDLSYVVNLSEVKSAHRADAEYFQPKYEKILNQSQKKSKLLQLSELASVKRGSLIDPKFYDDIEGTPYIRGKDFSSGRLEAASLVYISNDFKPRREIRVKTGDIVFASIGSVGTSALVTEEFNNSFISNNTGKISIKDKAKLLPEYLAVVLHSVVGKLQFEKESSQTAQPKISDTQVRSFKIPLLPKPTQQKIADLVRQSHEARKKAKELLEIAKKAVEIVIEQNEEEALKFLNEKTKN